MNNLKRLADQDDSAPNPRKYPRLLTQALKDDVKTESTDQTIISPSIALAATRPLHQPQPLIKSEPEIVDPIASKRSLPHLGPSTSSASNQSPLLRSLIRTTQPLATPAAPPPPPPSAAVTAKKDAPLYDLLQNLDSNDTPIFTTINSISTNKTPSIDPLEAFLSSAPTPPQGKPLAKDDYLAALLSSDPQQPSEISFVPLHKQQSAPNLLRSTSTSSETSRIAAIVNDLFTSTNSVASNNNAPTTNPNDDLFSLLDNRDFLEVNTPLKSHRIMIIVCASLSVF